MSSLSCQRCQLSVTLLTGLPSYNESADTNGQLPTLLLTGVHLACVFPFERPWPLAF